MQNAILLPVLFLKNVTLESITLFPLKKGCPEKYYFQNKQKHLTRYSYVQNYLKMQMHTDKQRNLDLNMLRRF